MRKINDIGDKMLLFGFLVNIGNQAAVDFHVIRGIPQQIGDIGVSRSVIVNGNIHVMRGAACLDFMQLLAFRLRLLGKFNHKLRKNVGILLTQFIKIRIREEMSRNAVHKNLFVPEFLDLSANCFQHVVIGQPFDLIKPSCTGRIAEQHQRRNFHAARNPHQRLIGINLTVLCIDNRLEIISQQILIQHALHQLAVRIAHLYAVRIVHLPLVHRRGILDRDSLVQHTL